MLRIGRKVSLLAVSAVPIAALGAAAIAGPPANARMSGRAAPAPMRVIRRDQARLDDIASWSVPHRNADGSKNILGNKFRDQAGGFVMRPPRHTLTIQQIGLNLASFVNRTRKWAVYVRLSPLRRNIPVPAMLKAMAARLQTQFQAVQLLESRQEVISGRHGGVQVASFDATSGKAPMALLRQQAIIEVHPNRYYVITLFTPLADKHAALPVFRAMVRSFHVLSRKKVTAERRAALAAGKAWLKHVSAGRLKKRLLARPQLFGIYMKHKNVGYLMISESVAHKGVSVPRANYKGLLVEVDSRIFPAAGGVSKTQVLSFWAFSHQAARPTTDGHRMAAVRGVQYSAWRIKTETVQRNWHVTQTEHLILDPTKKKYRVVKSNTSPVLVHWATELGTQQTARFPVFDRKGHETGEFVPQTRMTIAHARDHAQNSSRHLQHFPIPGSMPVLPPALNYLWPRMVNLSHPQTMAFFAYNSSQERPGLRILRVLGAQTITVNGRQMQAYKLTDELDPGETSLWVNSQGKILFMRTSDGTSLVPTTARRMRRRWGQRLAQMRELLNGR